MEFKPHPYQEISIDALLRNRKYALFLDCGLGKTVCTLQAIDTLKYDQARINKVLIIAPLIVAKDTWSREIEKWEHLNHLKISKILGSEKERIQALQHEADIYVINRDNVVWLVKHLGQNFAFDMVVIDELSSFKNPNSKRFKALRSVIGYPKRVVGLTATPASKSLIDLWSQVYLLDRGERLGKTITQYRNTYFRPGRSKGHIVYNYELLPGAEERIYGDIQDICLSLKAEDWLNVPELVDIYHHLELPDALNKSYKQFARELVLELENESLLASNRAVLLGKLLQFANGAIYLEDGIDYEELHTVKLDKLEELIEGANGNPVMVFYNFQHDKERIEARLKSNYSISDLKTTEDIAKWNHKEIDIALVHPASMGYGLNLQDGGNIIVWYGLTWSLELYQQALARLHRQGQTQKVLHHHLVMKHTVDEQVIESLQSKEENQERLLAAVRYQLNCEGGL